MPCLPALLFELVTYLVKHCIFDEIASYSVKNKNIRLIPNCLPEGEAPGEGGPLREPLALRDGGGAVLHDLEQRLRDLGQRRQRQPLPVRRGEGEGAVGAGAAAAAARPPLARRPRGGPEGRRGRRLHLGDAEEVVELGQRELVEGESQEPLALVCKRGDTFIAGLEKMLYTKEQRRRHSAQIPT